MDVSLLFAQLLHSPVVRSSVRCHLTAPAAMYKVELEVSKAKHDILIT